MYIQKLESFIEIETPSRIEIFPMITKSQQLDFGYRKVYYLWLTSMHLMENRDVQVSPYEKGILLYFLQGQPSFLGSDQPLLTYSRLPTLY